MAGYSSTTPPQQKKKNSTRLGKLGFFFEFLAFGKYVFCLTKKIYQSLVSAGMESLGMP